MIMKFNVSPARADKRPCDDGWQAVATKDPEVIQRWREQYRELFTHYLIPTGSNNDILVLDIDVKANGNGYETIANENLYIPPTYSQDSPSGGRHYFFKYPRDGKKYGNKVKFKKGLDTRGEGGYVLWYGINVQDLPIAEAPQWLLDAYSPKEITTTDGMPQTAFRLDDAVAWSQFTRAISDLQNAEEGGRNHTLNTISYVVGQICAASNLQQPYAIEQLKVTALAIGLDPHEITATINSGFLKGLKAPQSCVFDNLPPMPLPSMTELPTVPQEASWTPRFSTRAELMNRKKLRKPQLFEDYLSCDIALTVADGGTGKTTLKMVEAICLATGRDFLGFKNLVGGGRTIFLTGEDDEEKLRAMCGAICQQMGLFNEGNEELLEKVLDGVIIKADSELCLITKDRATGFYEINEAAYQKISTAISELNAVQFIFDPIASFWGTEQSPNDVAMRVTSFMSRLVKEHGVCVDMIAHMGKGSSKEKDESQMSARGGSALPSHSRIVRSLRPVDAEEFAETTGNELTDGKTAIKMVYSKFTDGSPLLKEHIFLVRSGYLFDKIRILKGETSKAERDQDRVFELIKKSTEENPLSTQQIIAFFRTQSNPISATGVRDAIHLMMMENEVEEVSHPNAEVRHKWLKVKNLTT